VTRATRYRLEGSSEGRRQWEGDKEDEGAGNSTTSTNATAQRQINPSPTIPVPKQTLSRRCRHFFLVFLASLAYYSPLAYNRIHARVCQPPSRQHALIPVVPMSVCRRYIPSLHLRCSQPAHPIPMEPRFLHYLSLIFITPGLLVIVSHLDSNFST
jgi:hypothetical protein